MKITDYIARRLAARGITHAFLVQGAANNDLIFSIADTPGIQYVCAQHEQGAGFMAEGWSKVRGLPAVAISTSGPGGQNLAVPIANCFYDSVAALFIAGQVNSKFMRRSDQMRQLGFQEWPAAECYRPITKYSKLVTRAEDVPLELERALTACEYGRPGPAFLEIPLDIQKAELPLDLVVPEVTKVTSHWTHEIGAQEARLAESITRVQEALRSAQRPLLLIGGGVRGRRALDAMDLLAEALRIPLIPTWNALDAVTSDHPWYGGRVGTYGGPGHNFAVQNCDLLIAVGCRISGRITGGRPETFARGARRFVVDVDDALLDPRNMEVPCEPIRADAGEFMRELERRWRDAQPEHPDWQDWWDCARAWRDRYDPVTPEMLADPRPHFYAFCRRLGEFAPSNAVVAYDCGGNAVAMNHAFRTKRGQRYYSNNGNSPMGFSFAAAIGSWFADPTRPVICVIGDGGMQLNIQELQTAVHYGAEVKVFILDNRIYGITQAFQDTHYAGRHEASGPDDYSAPDFRKIADAYGVDWVCIERSSEMQFLLKTALDRPGPCVCIVSCPGFHEYYPKIDGFGTPIEDMTPRLTREEFRQQMVGTEPLPGWETGEYA